MDLINDLENDMAFAFFVEKRHSQKINSEDSLALIRNLRSSLNMLATREIDADKLTETDTAARGMHG
jgi:hypothetical protein